MYSKVNDIVNKKIRPYLNSHGGDITVLKVDDHILTVRLTGRCSDCPSAMYSTRQMIQDIVCEQMPSIETVVIEEYTNPELLDMARSILNHNKES